MSHNLLIIVLLYIFVIILFVTYSYENNMDYYTNSINNNNDYLVIQYDNRDFFKNIIEYFNPSDFHKLIKVNEEYCLIHNLDYMFISSYDYDMPVYWMKVKIITDMLNNNSKYKGIIWLDSDAVFTNMDKSIRNIFNNDISFYIANDPPEYDNSVLNTGTWIVKNNNIGIKIMNDWLNNYNSSLWIKKDDNWHTDGVWAGIAYEQGTFNHIIYPKYKNDIQILSWDTFNNNTRSNKNAYISHYMFDRKEIINKEYYNDNIKYYLPKKTWTYWDNDIPPSVENIINLRNANLDEYEHIILSDSNIYNYIDKNEFPKNYNQLAKQHKADWIRLYLLYKYGGTWIDSSIIITKLNDINEIYDNCYKNKYELMAFYLDQRLINNDKYTYIENWFLIAPVNSNIIKKWKQEFEYAIDIGFDEYLNEIRNNVNITNLGDSNYLTMHSTIKKLITHNEVDKNKIYLKKADDDMFNLHIKCNWDTTCIHDALKNDKHLNLKYVKLRGNDRDDSIIINFFTNILEYFI
jgi:hypothetical protein